MLKAFIVALAMLTGACAPWRTRDYAMETGFAAAMYVDYDQTEQIIKCERICQPHFRVWEHNPMIGSQGQSMSPSTYFVGSMALHILAVTWMPEKYRTAFQAVSIGVETGQVLINYEFEIGKF